MAVFELQCVERHSELQERHLDRSLIARVIQGLTTNLADFPDLRSATGLYDMDARLRLLALGLRLYKYDGQSLEQNLYTSVYNGITRLWEEIETNCNRRYETLGVEDFDVAFLLKHCQYLLASIESSGSFSKQVSKRAIHGFDLSMTRVSKPMVPVIKLQRSRPKWHDEYMVLEDICWSVFAGNIRARDFRDDDAITALVDEAIETTNLLRDTMEIHLPEPRKKTTVRNVFRRSAATALHIDTDSAPFEEKSEYLRYGILDLMYQLSFRIRSRSQRKCLPEFFKVVRLVLERSPPNATLFHAKATDLWNRFLEFGSKQYGDVEDLEAIKRWIDQNYEKAESKESSKKYLPDYGPDSNRI
jgi:hypothetical protein